MANKSIYQYIDEYMSYAFSTSKNKSKTSEISYYGKLKEFADIMTEIKGENFNVSDITFEDLQQYVDILGADKNDKYIKNGRGNAPSSVRNKYTVVKTFIKFLKKRKVFTNDITIDEIGEGVDLPTIDKNEVKYLGEDECYEMLRRITWRPGANDNVYDGEFVSMRNYVLLLTSFTTGLRRFELLGLKWDNIINNSIVIRGKGRRERSIPLHPFTKEMLEKWHQYLNKRLAKKDDEELKKYDLNLVFPSNRGDIITDGAYWVIVEKALNTIGRGRYKVDENGNYILDENGNKILNPKALKPHSIRKGFASLLNKNGVQTAIIQNLLGHSSIDTTMRYIGISDSTKRKAVDTIQINLELNNNDD